MGANLKKDYFWNTVGVFLQNAISPLLLIVVARFNGVYDVGLFSFAFSVSVIFYAIGVWGGRTYQVSDVKKQFQSQGYIMMRLMLGAVMLIGAIVFCVMNDYDSFKTTLILSLVCFKLLESIADVLYGVLQIHGKLYEAGISLTVKTIVSILGFILIDGLTNDLIFSSLAIGFVNLAALFLYDMRRVALVDDSLLKFTLSKHIKQALEIMKQSAPVFIVSFLVLFSLYIPRYFIDIFHPDQNGYFGIIAMPITLVLLVVTFILQPNIVALSHLYEQKKYEKFDAIVLKIGVITTGLGLMIVLGTYLIGVQALNIIFDLDFGQYKTELIIIVVGGVINALVAIAINILTVMRRFKGLFIVLLITDLALAAVSGWLVASGGMLAGVSLFTVTTFMQVVLLYGVYRYGVYKGRHEKS